MKTYSSKHMENNQEWYKKIGLEKNPFKLDPLKQEVILDDFIKKELLYRIESGSIIFIKGSEGSGKTTYLKFLIDKFKGNKEVIYFDCKNLEFNLNIKKILLERQNFFDKITKKLPLKMILIIDNVQIMNKKNSERLKYYFDHDFIKSIVFTGTSLKNFSESLLHRIGKRIIKIKKLDESIALKIINQRTNYKDIVPEEKLKHLLKLSNYNPKYLIQNCEALCQYLIEENTYDGLDKLTSKQITQELEKAQEKYLGEINGRTMV